MQVVRFAVYGNVFHTCSLQLTSNLVCWMTFKTLHVLALDSGDPLSDLSHDVSWPINDQRSLRHGSRSGQGQSWCEVRVRSLRQEGGFQAITPAAHDQRSRPGREEVILVWPVWLRHQLQVWFESSRKTTPLTTQSTGVNCQQSWWYSANIPSSRVIFVVKFVAVSLHLGTFSVCCATKLYCQRQMFGLKSQNIFLLVELSLLGCGIRKWYKVTVKSPA